jgi:hypothetical protein
MALFGAPIAHEDHAVRACYAALAMQEAVGHYGAALRRSQGLDVQIRVGLPLARSALLGARCPRMSGFFAKSRPDVSVAPLMNVLSTFQPS